MKARTKEPAAPTRVEFRVRFEAGPKGGRGIRERGVVVPPEIPPATVEGSTAAHPAPHCAPPDVPKVTQLLVVAYWWERLIEEGKVKDYAEIARLTGLSRARVSQIADLTLLGRDRLEAYLSPYRELDNRSG